MLTGAPAQPLGPVKVFGAGTVAGFPEAAILRMRNRDGFTAALLQRAVVATRGRKRGAPLLLRSARTRTTPARFAIRCRCLAPPRGCGTARRTRGS